MARWPSPNDRPRGGNGPDSASPRIGTTLLILDDSVDRPAVVLTLKERGLRPVLLPLAEDAREVVSRWLPEAVILRAGRPDWTTLLAFLGQKGVPCVLLGTATELRNAKRLHQSSVQLLVPAEPDEIADGAQLVIGTPAARRSRTSSTSGP